MKQDWQNAESLLLKKHGLRFGDDKKLKRKTGIHISLVFFLMKMMEFNGYYTNMEILLLSIGSSGDVNPFIFLGKALKSRNHWVTMITNDYFRETVEKAGLNFYAVGTKEEYLRLTNNPQLFHPQKAFGYVVKNFVLKYMKDSYEAIKKLSGPETTIIAQSIAPGARIAHEKLKIPLLTLNLQPVSFWSIENPPVFSGLNIPNHWPYNLKKLLLNTVEKLFIDPAFAKGINPFLKELGLPAQKHFFSRWFYSPLGVVGLFPEWFASPASDWPVNTKLTGFVKWQQPGELDNEIIKFIDDAEAPVVFTAGSAMQHAGEFFKTACGWAEKYNKRAILISSFPDQIPSNPGQNVFICSNAPFDKLFPLVAAIVHHGGIGTVAPAIAARKPQLIVPFAHDQPDNAHRVEKLGLGFTILPNKFSVERLAQKLDELLKSPAIADGCYKYSVKMKKEDSLKELLDFVESYKQI